MDPILGQFVPLYFLPGPAEMVIIGVIVYLLFARLPDILDHHLPSNPRERQRYLLKLQRLHELQRYRSGVNNPSNVVLVIVALCLLFALFSIVAI